MINYGKHNFTNMNPNHDQSNKSPRIQSILTYIKSNDGSIDVIYILVKLRINQLICRVLKFLSKLMAYQATLCRPDRVLVLAAAGSFGLDVE